MTYSRIVGTGSYLPAKVLSNHDLEKIVDTSDQWIQERTGIRERRLAADDEYTCDLAEAASRAAIDMAGISASDIDMIVVATTTPDQIFPSSACLLQAKLGVVGCPAFDVQAVCTGFVYALSIADQYIKTGASRCALVVGAETLSRIIDWTDRSTCVLFGDGAGAVVLKSSDTQGILSTHIHADGRYAEYLEVPFGVSRRNKHSLSGETYMRMNGNEVFRMAVRTLGRIVDETLQANGLKRDAVDWLVPHQANQRIIEATARRLRLPMEQVVLTVAEHGNTSAASIPLALDVAVRDGRIKKGDLLLLEAFGGGFTWGSALVRF